MAAIEVDDDLDWISCRILTALHDAGGTATTREIKELTGVTEGTKVPYRVKSKLSPNNLVDITRRGVDENGQNLPMKISLTDQGLELAHRIGEDNDLGTPDITEQTDKLSADITQLQSRITDLEETVTDITKTLKNRESIDDQVADSLEELDKRLQSVEEEVHAEEPPSSV